MGEKFLIIKVTWHFHRVFDKNNDLEHAHETSRVLELGNVPLLSFKVDIQEENNRHCFFKEETFNKNIKLLLPMNVSVTDGADLGLSGLAD